MAANLGAIGPLTESQAQMQDCPAIAWELESVGEVPRDMNVI